MTKEDRIIVSYEGKVIVYLLSYLKSGCSVNMKYYPFDTQKCLLTFTSWLHNWKEIMLYTYTGEGERM